MAGVCKTLITATLGVALLAACAPKAARPGADGKLPEGVTPLSYALALTIDPRVEHFSGEARIHVSFNKATKSFWIHGRDIAVKTITVTPASGEAITATYREDGKGFAEITLERTAPAGAADVNIAYDAPFAGGAAGLYRADSGGDKYAITQFESIDARRAFPGFDEPRFKTPFDISIVARAGDTAISNTGEEKAEPAGAGLVRHTYRTTLPLPTYLIAFAVGPYEVVDGPVLAPNAIRKHPVPLRGVAAKGKGQQTRFALANTAKIIEYFETYFDTAYPYDKLDFIAAPEFSAGAMENAGAIVYAETAILMEPGGPVSQQRGIITTHAHEIAHQWFGDLVTPAWWDDIWLNEAFATWMSYKAATAVYPDGGYGRETQLEALAAMDDDSLSSARRIREPIRVEADIEDAFDSITYDKGGGVLAMAESYLGEDAFREGVRRHMRRFPFGVATSKDFFDSLGQGSKHPEIVQALESFTDRNHVPLVDVRVTCDANTPPQARIAQTTFEPIGVSLENRTWNIPVCVNAYGLTGGPARSCAILSEPTGTMLLNGACPAFVAPNAGGSGYYRFSLDERGWTALVAAFRRLSPGEQIATLDSLHASFSAGRVASTLLLRGIESAAGAADLDVRRKAADVATELAWIPETDAARADYAAWVRNTFGAVRVEAAMSSRASAAERQTATTVTKVLALYGRDRALRTRLLAGARASIGLSRGAPVSADLRSVALAVGVEDGGPAFFNALLEKAKTSSDSQFRSEALAALTRVQRPEDQKAIAAALLSEPFTGSQMRRALLAARASPPSANFPFAMLRDNFDAVLARLPGGLAGQSAPALASGLCSGADKKTLADLFAANAAKAPGYERALAQTTERIGRCAALRAAKAGELAGALTVTR
ncbi:MAG: M1 family metallopeptidase [Hyphomonadaceae bacterium]|nr:MAG: putative M1 family peptidase [Caulobacteraceae bacterium]MBT9444270.1 M1 family metallopeptidase [Hyphomonadaceae bacterium]